MHEPKSQITRRDSNSTESEKDSLNLENAKVLVRRLTAELGIGRLRGWPEFSVQGKFPEKYLIAYPVLVCDEGEVGGSGLSGAGDECKWYSKTPTGATMHGLRWLVLRTYGELEEGAYSPQGFTGVRMNEQRFFTDAWVVDLKHMVVVAHHRFADDPLPDVLGGDYHTTQRSKVAEKIKSWLEENIQ